MKISVCDICYKQNDMKTLTESTHRIGYKGHATYNIDVCAQHHMSYQLESLPKHMQFVLGLDGIDIDEEKALRLV